MKKEAVKVGDKFGMLVVVKTNVFKDKYKRWFHEVKCVCGTQKYIANGGLYHTKSCGCWRRERFSQINEKRRIKLKKGQVFGLLTVEKYSGQGGRGTGTQYLCKCVCGNQKNVSAGTLTRGQVKSCGCLKSPKSPNPTCRKKQRNKDAAMRSAMLYDCYVKSTIQNKSMLKSKDIPMWMVAAKRIYLENYRKTKGL